MLTAAQVDDFRQKGFLAGAVVLSDEEIERLRSELDLVIQGETTKKPVLHHNMLGEQSEQVVIQIVNMWMASEAYRDHAANRTIAEEVAQLCGTKTLRVFCDQVQFKLPGNGGPAGWHQDHPCWPILEPADLVTAWVPLDDATVETGCMWMVPGSHKWGNHLDNLSADENFRAVHRRPDLLPANIKIDSVPHEIKKGQVSYHHCMVWHGSPPNKTSQKRRAIAVHYMPDHTIYVPTGAHPIEPFITVKLGEKIAGGNFPIVFGGIRGIEWANRMYESARKLCISIRSLV